MDVAPLYKLLTLVASLYEFCIHKLFVMLNALVISPSFQSGYQVVSCIADISHHYHYQQWYTFFKPVYILEWTTRNLTYFGYFETQLHTFFFAK